MAIRERKGSARPWQCYWNNHFTGKRESLSFATKEEAEKEDSLVRHRLRFERESFRPEIKSELGMGLSLEAAYLAYLKEKQFSTKNMEKQHAAFAPILKAMGRLELADIHYEDLLRLFQNMARNIKSSTLCRRMGILRAILRWSANAACARCHASPNCQLLIMNALSRLPRLSLQP